MLHWNFFRDTTERVEERRTEQFYLWPNPDVDIYHDMNIVGISIDPFDIHFCLEQGTQQGKQFMVYKTPSDGARAPSSRQYVHDAKNFLKTADDFHARQENAIYHGLFILNQTEYAQFYTKLEEIWWKNPKPAPKSLSTTLLESIGLIQPQPQPVKTHQQELADLIESIQHLKLEPVVSIEALPLS